MSRIEFSQRKIPICLTESAHECQVSRKTRVWNVSPETNGQDRECEVLVLDLVILQRGDTCMMKKRLGFPC